MDLYIIGAGNVGGFLAYHANQFGKFILKGFIDDDESKQGKYIYDLPVIGKVDILLNIDKPFAVAVAIGNPINKKRIVELLKQNKQVVFPSFIHPSVWIGQKVIIKKGCIIYPGVTINYETEIDDFVTINMNASVGHNCRLNDFSTLSPGVNCGGFTVIGEESFLGIGSCTIQSIKIGNKSIVGAGAIVIRDIPDNVVVAGVPAKIIKSGLND